MAFFQSFQWWELECYILSVYKETHVRNILRKWNASCSKDLLHGTPDGPLLTNGGRNHERETTATTGCLVEILRTNPNNRVQSFWLWASAPTHKDEK